MKRMKIVVRLQIEGTHCWNSCNITEVGYLANVHRHRFGIVAKMEVHHDDRDVEFIKLGHQIEQYLTSKYANRYGVCDFGSKSCEMLAIELLDNFGLTSCEVNEDGEHGAEVER